MHNINVQNNDKLLKLVILELLKEGLKCRIDSLIDLNPTIRKYLGDNKISTYLSTYPQIFSFASNITLESFNIENCNEPSLKQNAIVNLRNDWKTFFSIENINGFTTIENSIDGSIINSSKSSKCERCEQLFNSRNKLFNHLKSRICYDLNKLNLIQNHDILKIDADQKTFTKETLNLFEYTNISSYKLASIGIESSESKSITKKILYELLIYLKNKQVLRLDKLSKQSLLINQNISHEYIKYNDKNEFVIDTTIYIPLLWITTLSTKFKRYLRIYVRELAMNYLAPNKREIYDSPKWWELISCELLKLISIFPTIFQIICVCHNDSINNNNSNYNKQIKIVSNESDFDVLNIAENMELLRTTYIHMYMNSEIDDYICNIDINTNKINFKNSKDILLKSNHVNAINNDNIMHDIKILEYNSYYHVITVDKPAHTRMEDLLEQLKKQLKSNSNYNNNLESIKNDNELQVLHDNNNNDTFYDIKSVSRLDQQTSGVVILPLSHFAEQHLTKQFKNRLTKKYYLCIVQGIMKSNEYGIINAKLKHIDKCRKTFIHPNGKLASTRYWCLHTYHIVNSNNNNNNNNNNNKIETIDNAITTNSKNDNNNNYFSLVLCQPLTGRTHQIRVHMAYINHPLIGDKKYNKKKQLYMERNLHNNSNNTCSNNNSSSSNDNHNNSVEYIYSNFRLMLHSYQLIICLNDNENKTVHEDKDFIISKSYLPPDFIELLNILFRNNTMKFDDHNNNEYNNKNDNAVYDNDGINKRDIDEFSYNLIKQIKEEILFQEVIQKSISQKFDK